MKKLKNYRFSFNLLILMGVVFILSSCSREMGSVSYNNEKLRKQSIELENSSSKGRNVESVEKTATVNTESQAAETITASTSEEPSEVATSPKPWEKSVQPSKAAEKKLNVAQKLVLKKLAKKLSPESKAAVKRGGIDGDLKLAIIIGLVGVVLILLGGIAGAWIFGFLGAVALVIALVLFIIWLVENA